MGRWTEARTVGELKDLGLSNIRTLGKFGTIGLCAGRRAGSLGRLGGRLGVRFRPRPGRSGSNGSPAWIAGWTAGCPPVGLQGLADRPGRSPEKIWV